MNILMISYDLNQPGQKYDEVHTAIQSLGAWCKYLESAYLVKTSSTIQEAQDLISKHLDPSDKMIICTVTGEILGWLSEEQWEWIKTNISDS